MKRTLVTTVIFCAALCAWAQSPLGLTYPLGAPDLAVSGAAAAMGGTGTAVVNEYIGASVNPANAAVGGRSVFSALISYDMTSVYDNGKSDDASGYIPKLISLIIPIGRAGNLGFSMQRRYDANLNFYTESADDARPPLDERTTNVTSVEIRRTGGLTSWQAGWAYRFRNGVGLGVIYEGLFFNLDSRNVFNSTLSYNMDGATESYSTTVVDSAVAAFASGGLRFGMQIPVNEKVTLGFAGEYALPGRGNGTETGGRRYDAASTSGGGYDTSFSVTLPPSMSVGAAYKPDDNWLFAADAYTVWWEFYENGFKSDDAKQCFGLSFGARYIPAANILSSKYWERVHYAAGVRYATLPNNKEDRDRAHEYAFSAGAGLPIPRDGGMVDFVISFGRRSDPKYGNYEENFVKLQIGLNGGRNWFQKDASKEY